MKPPKYSDPKRQQQYERGQRWRANNKARAKASVTKFYTENPQWRREQHLRRTYGIGLQDLYVALELQRNGCATCGAKSTGRKTRAGNGSEWIVDHDHNTGKIRGVICHPCNVVIGLVKDSPSILRDIAAYLEGHQ